jgi:hypothetical protein
MQPHEGRKKSAVQLDARELEELIKEHREAVKDHNDHVDFLKHSREDMAECARRRDDALKVLKDCEGELQLEAELVFTSVKAVESSKSRCDQVWEKMESLLKKAPRIILQTPGGEAKKVEPNVEEEDISSDDDSTVVEGRAAKIPRITPLVIRETSSVLGLTENPYHQEHKKKKSAKGNQVAAGYARGKRTTQPVTAPFAPTTPASATVENRGIVSGLTSKRVSFVYPCATMLASYKNEEVGYDDEGSPNLLESD